jgi:hypothetical protein
MGVENPTSSWQELLARDRLENDINRQRHAASLMTCSFSDIQGVCDFMNISWGLIEKWVLGIQICQTPVQRRLDAAPYISGWFVSARWYMSNA